MQNEFKEGQRVVCHLTENFNPVGTIVLVTKSHCFVKWDTTKGDKGCVCRHSQLALVSE